MRLIGSLVLLMFATSCFHYQIHPGSIDTLDSTSYDTLQIAQAAINTAKASATLTIEQKQVLGTTVLYYNIARDAWIEYRHSVHSIASTSKAAALNQAITDLNTSLTTLRTGGK